MPVSDAANKQANRDGSSPALTLPSSRAPYVLCALLSDAVRPYAEVEKLQTYLGSFGVAHSIAVDEDGTIIAVISSSDICHLIQYATEQRKARKRRLAISLPFEDEIAIAPQHELAKFCLSESGEQGVHYAKDTALAYLKSEVTKHIDPKDLLHPALAKLSDYDKNNHSNLLDTLRVYLEHDRNAQRCASLLYLHRNSLQYRIRRIQNIADINLDDPYERAYLRISFFLSS